MNKLLLAGGSAIGAIVAHELLKHGVSGECVDKAERLLKETEKVHEFTIRDFPDLYTPPVYFEQPRYVGYMGRKRRHK
ncbi:hypothetical protein [Hymenobacter glacieicola]|uniref:Uncharacterized protein n=1 Tax=Hymenobacter glacieicola TaxID=1562124 RepID=A0ABQ1X8B7_9BACT|nr:hypothetical protein [Hymenobacter glacieicola]GGG60785.1 hypothetical protein GCM10011378_41020 [Hymenobacter glacieicola]